MARGQPRITTVIKGAAGPRGTDPTRCQTNVEASLTPGTATGYRANGIRPQNCFILCHCRILNVLPAAAAPSGEHQRQILLLGVIAGNAAAVHLALVVAGVAIKGVVAIRVSKYRPACPIIGCSVNKDVCRKMSLSWGVTPLLVELKHNSDELFDHAVDKAEEMGLIKQGEIVVLTAGVPLGISGTTNMIKVHVAGHILMRGKGLNDKVDSGNMCVVNSAEELKEKFKVGDIIVAKDTCNEMMEQIRLSSGLILEKNSINCHGAIAGLSLDIPVLIGAENATQILKSGAFVTLDGKKGIVSCNN